MEDTNTFEEAKNASPKHFREALDSLPSLEGAEAQSAPEPEDGAAEQTVIVTHVMPPQDETTILTPSNTPESAETTVIDVLDVSKETASATSQDAETAQQESIAEEMALTSLVTPLETVDDDQEPVVAMPAVEAAVEQETFVAPISSDPVSTGVKPVESPFAQEASQSSAKKILTRVGVVCGVLVALACVAYIIGGFYFSSHFLPNTTVNGKDVSGLSIDELKEYVVSIGENYTAHIAGDGVDLTVTGPEIDFGYNEESYSTHAAEQINNWQWPLELNKTHEYVVNDDISFNEEKLNKIVGEVVDKANEGSTQPTNATLTYNEESGAFEVVPDALGTAINKDAVLPVASEGVATMQTEISLGDNELVQPTIAKDNATLLEKQGTMNGLLENPVALKIAGTDATTVDKGLISGWLSIDGDLNINVNQDAIKEWAMGPLSEQFDTVGTKRTYTRPDGKVIEVEGSSADFEYDYGWCLDGEELARILSENLRNNNTDPIDVPMKKSAATWNPGGQEWSNRYVDVDLSEQHVRMYDENSNLIWESDCVSGNPIYGGGTDTGVFFIYMKANPMELIGLDYNGDGQPDYRTWVTYWMPFDGGEGLHDMASRYSFGGSIYTWNGSHGCVNLPYSAAEQLYQLTNVGDPVIVHW